MAIKCIAISTHITFVPKDSARDTNKQQQQQKQAGESLLLVYNIVRWQLSTVLTETGLVCWLVSWLNCESWLPWCIHRSFSSLACFLLLENLLLLITVKLIEVYIYIYFFIILSSAIYNISTNIQIARVMQ